MKKLVLPLLLLTVASCKTYYMTPAGFKEQITGTVPFHLKNEEMSYLGAKMDVIRCRDNKGREVTLQNSPSIEVRFIEKNGQRKTYYFNTVVFQNDTITGGISRFMPQLTSSIPLDSLAKVEVQDGGKKFRSGGHTY